jgi:hypothetical protein
VCVALGHQWAVATPPPSTGASSSSRASPPSAYTNAIDSCTSRLTPAARAARAIAADASVRSRSFSRQADGSAMRSVVGTCVSRLMTASVPSNARRREVSSNTSASTAPAPRTSSRLRPLAERVTPVTRLPAASTSRTASRPMTPVDPVMVISFMPTDEVPGKIVTSAGPRPPAFSRTVGCAG